MADYGIGTATKGTMSRLGTAVYLDELEEWDYTTADGTNVLLGIAERKSLLYVELEHCYVLAVIRAGYEGRGQRKRYIRVRLEPGRPHGQ